MRSPSSIFILMILGISTALSQPARTTIAAPVFRADGTRFTGTINCSWPTFTSADSIAIPRGNANLPVTAGVLNATLVPTDALSGTSTNTRYTCRYSLSNGQPISPPMVETWNVPTSGPVTSLDTLRTVSPPPFTSIAAPNTAQFITRRAETGLSAEFSLGTLTDNSIIAVDTDASVATPRAAVAGDFPTSILNGTVAYCADAGSSDTYACSLSPVPASYVTGSHACFKANTANTGAATINFNSLGAKTIVKVVGGVTTTLADNDIRSGQVVCLNYDGTNMQMQSMLGNAASGSGDLLSSNNLSDVANAATALANLGIVKFSCTTAPDVTCTFYDDTATTGVTQYIIRAGAGQNAALQQWQDSAGTTLASTISTGELWFLSAGSVKTEKGTHYLMASDACAKFHSGTNIFGTSADAGLCRNAAGVVEVNNGSAGTFRDLKLRTLKKSTLTIATLPGTPAAGDEVDVTDSATGDCVTGGGSIFAGCRYNGTAWEAF